ncbi:MAG: YXWGXW repeat-containing protein [Stenomitos rutilans HA7619-LM2]|jgi:hypothetical protein|nr:YXWGXW repeat-containing protein [Stenomitos rutilans HA7619-LM2]
MQGIKGVIAAAIMALPIAGTALVLQPASAEVVIRRPVVVRRAPVVVQAPRRAERRVWVAGRWDYSNRQRHWIPGHYEYRR